MVAVTVKVTLVPAVTGLGEPDLVRAMSAEAMVETDADAELLAELGSDGSVAEMVAVLVKVVAGGVDGETVNTIMKVRVPPGGVTPVKVQVINPADSVQPAGSEKTEVLAGTGSVKEKL